MVQVTERVVKFASSLDALGITERSVLAEYTSSLGETEVTAFSSGCCECGEDSSIWPRDQGILDMFRKGFDSPSGNIEVQLSAEGSQIIHVFNDFAMERGRRVATSTPIRLRPGAPSGLYIKIHGRWISAETTEESPHGILFSKLINHWHPFLNEEYIT